MNLNLKVRRKELGLTLKDVAESVGVTPATVSRWENGGIANMGKDKVQSLAKVLQVDPNLIIGTNSFEDPNLNSYNNKTFDEFLNSLDQTDEISLSLVLNKTKDNSSKEIEVIKIPKNAQKSLFNTFKLFKNNKNKK